MRVALHHAAHISIFHPYQESFMSNLPTSLFRIAALAALVGGLAFTTASYADTAAPNAGDKKMLHEQKDMEKHVEQRIKTLHDKLDITPAQEAKWNDVAQTMRSNEDAISQLMKQRYENRKTMNAIDDLQSYEAIAEAHTEGLKKMIPVFQALYADMTDDQKKDADEAFGRFEGHRDGQHGKKHG
jgi:periplasmic protein CpxP/Spy